MLFSSPRQTTSPDISRTLFADTAHRALPFDLVLFFKLPLLAAEDTRVTHVTAGQTYWGRRLFQSLHFEVADDSYTVYCDNKRAVDVANSTDGAVITKMKHVDIRQMWIRQEVKEGRLQVVWVPTANQKADGFTKLLPKHKFEDFVACLGMSIPKGI